MVPYCIMCISIILNVEFIYAICIMKIKVDTYFKVLFHLLQEYFRSVRIKLLVFLNVEP